MRLVRSLRHASLPALLLALPVLASACKTRDPDAGGLLTSDDPPEATPGLALGDEVAPGGEWTIVCKSADADPDPSTYIFELQGAVSETDESQTVLVTATRQRRSQRDVEASRQLGHAAVAPHGPLFLGFAGGVLTADAVKTPAEAQGRTHVGILTLAAEKTAEGLRVACTVTRKS